MGKLIVAAALALVAGIFIGGVGPRAELARVRKDLEAARAEANRGGGAGALPLAALGLGGLAAAQREARDRAEELPPPRFQPVPEHPAPGGEPEERAERRRQRPDGGGNPFESAEALSAAKAAASLRAAQYREAFFQEARLSTQGQAAVTTIVADMNRELGQAAEELKTQLEGRAKLSPRDMADVGAKMLDVYRRADDRLKAGLDAQGTAAVEKTGFDLMTQFDLGAVEGLVTRLGSMDSADVRSLP